MPTIEIPPPYAKLQVSEGRIQCSRSSGLSSTQLNSEHPELFNSDPGSNSTCSRSYEGDFDSEASDNKTDNSYSTLTVLSDDSGLQQQHCLLDPPLDFKDTNLGISMQWAISLEQFNPRVLTEEEDGEKFINNPLSNFEWDGEIDSGREQPPQPNSVWSENSSLKSTYSPYQVSPNDPIKLLSQDSVIPPLIIVLTENGSSKLDQYHFDTWIHRHVTIIIIVEFMGFWHIITGFYYSQPLGSYRVFLV